MSKKESSGIRELELGELLCVDILHVEDNILVRKLFTLHVKLSNKLADYVFSTESNITEYDYNILTREGFTFRTYSEAFLPEALMDNSFIIREHLLKEFAYFILMNWVVEKLLGDKDPLFYPL